MNPIDKLYEFIAVQYTKEEQLQLAAKIMSSYAAKADKETKLPYSQNSNTREELPTQNLQNIPQKQDIQLKEELPVKQQAKPEIKTEFRGNNGGMIPYNMIRTKITTNMKPKNLAKLRSVINTLAVGYNGLTDAVLQNIIDQLISDGAVVVGENEKLIWG